MPPSKRGRKPGSNKTDTGNKDKTETDTPDDGQTYLVLRLRGIETDGEGGEPSDDQVPPPPRERSDRGRASPPKKLAPMPTTSEQPEITWAIPPLPEVTAQVGAMSLDDKEDPGMELDPEMTPACEHVTTSEPDGTQRCSTCQLIVGNTPGVAIPLHVCEDCTTQRSPDTSTTDTDKDRGKEEACSHIPRVYLRKCVGCQKNVCQGCRPGSMCLVQRGIFCGWWCKNTCEIRADDYYRDLGILKGDKDDEEKTHSRIEGWWPTKYVAVSTDCPKDDEFYPVPHPTGPLSEGKDCTVKEIAYVFGAALWTAASNDERDLAEIFFCPPRPGQIGRAPSVTTLFLRSPEGYMYWKTECIGDRVIVVIDRLSRKCAVVMTTTFDVSTVDPMHTWAVLPMEHINAVFNDLMASWKRSQPTSGLPDKEEASGLVEGVDKMEIGDSHTTESETVSPKKQVPIVTMVGDDQGRFIEVDKDTGKPLSEKEARDSWKQMMGMPPAKKTTVTETPDEDSKKKKKHPVTLLGSAHLMPGYKAGKACTWCANAIRDYVPPLCGLCTCIHERIKEDKITRYNKPYQRKSRTHFEAHERHFYKMRSIEDFTPCTDKEDCNIAEIGLVMGAEILRYIDSDGDSQPMVGYLWCQSGNLMTWDGKEYGDRAIVTFDTPGKRMCRINLISNFYPRHETTYNFDLHMDVVNISYHDTLTRQPIRKSKFLFENRASCYNSFNGWMINVRQSSLADILAVFLGGDKQRIEMVSDTWMRIYVWKNPQFTGNTISVGEHVGDRAVVNYDFDGSAASVMVMKLDDKGIERYKEKTVTLGSIFATVTSKARESSDSPTPQ